MQYLVKPCCGDPGPAACAFACAKGISVCVGQGSCVQGCIGKGVCVGNCGSQGAPGCGGQCSGRACGSNSACTGRGCGGKRG